MKETLTASILQKNCEVIISHLTSSCLLLFILYLNTFLFHEHSQLVVEIFSAAPWKHIVLNFQKGHAHTART